MVGLALGMAAVAAVATPGTASASQNNACYNQNACFWYGSWNGSTGTGAVAGFTDGYIPDLLPYHFGGAGSGSGTPVGNNSHSAKDNWSNETMHVYYSVNRGGYVDTLYPGQGRNFISQLVNNDRSLQMES